MKHAYAISCDWLQLHLHKPADFNPSEEHQSGYHFIDAGHGTKIFKKVYKVVDPDGQELGVITYDPYSPVINPSTLIFKLDNRVLYQSNYIERTFMFIAAVDLRYKGITRIDLAYDCNEYANGLNPKNLIKRYMNREYLKIGLNQGSLNFVGTYHINEKKPKYPSAEELDSDFNMTGIQWGSRKSDITVNLYDKTRELREQEMKHYIVDYWKLCGVDPERPVWRTEIRIQNGGKSLKELNSGRLFNLSIDDLITQETVEQMFHTYAKKYFRFVKRDNHAKAQQMIALKLLSTDNEIKMRPKRVTNTKNYTRMHKIIINNLNAHLYETAKIDAQVYNSIEYVKKYFVNAYGLEKWDQEQDARLTLKQETNDHVDKEQQEKIDRSTGKYYTDHYQHFASDVARRAAEAFKNIEEQIKKYKQRREDEQNE